MKRYIAIIPALIILSHIFPAYSQEKPVKCDVLLKEVLSKVPVDEVIPDGLPSDDENQPSAQQILAENNQESEKPKGQDGPKSQQDQGNEQPSAGSGATQASGEGGEKISQHDNEGSSHMEVEASQEKSNSTVTQPESESQPHPSQTQLQKPIEKAKKPTKETDDTPPGKDDAEGKTDPTKPMEPCEKAQITPCPSIAPKETMPDVQASKPVISEELEKSLIGLSKTLPNYKLDISENLDKKLDSYIGKILEKLEVSWPILIFTVVIGPLLVSVILLSISSKWFPDESLQDLIKSLFHIYITVIVVLVILCFVAYAGSYILSLVTGSTTGVYKGPDEVMLSLPDDISKPLKKFLETSHSDGTGKENTLKVSEKLEKALIKIAESEDTNKDRANDPGVHTGPDEVRLSLPDDISKPLKKFLESSHSDGAGKENTLKVSEKLENALIEIAKSKGANGAGAGETIPTKPVTGQEDGSTATTSVTGKEDGSSVMLWFILLAYWVVGALCLSPATKDTLKALFVNTLIVFAFLIFYWFSTTSGPMLYMAVLLLFLLPFYFKLIEDNP